MYPNPAQAGNPIAISFAGEIGENSVTIFNVRGELVRDLFKGTQSVAAPKTATWDQKGPKGYLFAAGVYVAVIRAGPKLYFVRLAILQK